MFTKTTNHLQALGQQILMIIIALGSRAFSREEKGEKVREKVRGLKPA